MTAVEWLFENLNIYVLSEDMKAEIKIFEQAKEMERNQAHAYAEFAIRCDRKMMKILNFKDWVKL